MPAQCENMTAYLQSPAPARSPLDTFYTNRVLHQTIFTPDSGYNTEFDTIQSLHQPRVPTPPFTPNTFGSKKHTKYYTRHLLRQKTFTQETIYTKHLLTQTNFYTRNLLHQTPFTQGMFYSRQIYTKQFLHQATLTPETFFTKHFLYLTPQQVISAPNKFSTRHLLHQTLLQHAPFTPECFYTRQFLCQKPFATGTFYTKQSLHQKPLGPNSIYAKQFLDQDHFTLNTFCIRRVSHQKIFYTKRGLHQLHFVRQRTRNADARGWDARKSQDEEKRRRKTHMKFKNLRTCLNYVAQIDERLL